MEMKTEKIRVNFHIGYSGAVQCRVNIGDETHSGMTYGEAEGLSRGIDYVLEIPELVKRLEKEIEEKGYRVEQTKRQKYPRIIIND